jgi:hypothetical protein
MAINYVAQPMMDFNPTVALTVSTTTPEYPGAPMTVGTGVETNLGGRWLYVQVAASKSCTAGDFVVVVDHSAFTIDQLSNTTGKNFLGSIVGIAGATATAGQYLWIQTRGYNASVNCATSSTAFTALHTSSTAGRSTTTGSAGNSAIITNAVILATAASNTAACYLNDATVGAND